MQTYDLVQSRNRVKAEREMLKHAAPLKVLGSFGMQKQMPRNQTDTLSMRRAVPIDAATSGAAAGAPQVSATDYLLQEGITPAARTIDYEDVNVTLQEYGVLMKLTSKTEATYEDNVPQDMIELVAQHMVTLEEMIAYNVVRGGTNVVYANGSARTDVNTVISLGKLRQCARNIENAHGRRVTKKLTPGTAFGTSSVLPSYLVFVHTDLEADVRNLPGFTKVVDYGSGGPVHDREFGAVENFRFISSPYFRPWLSAGTSPTTTPVGSVLSAGVANTGTSDDIDVYPVLVTAEDAWGQVALAGQGAVKPIYLPAKDINHANPLGRFGYVGAQFLKAAVRLNEQWMVRLEVAASAL